MRKYILILLMLCATLFILSCEEDDPLLSPDGQALRKIKDTEILLRNNLWGFNDFIVDVKYEMRAIPLLANVADQDGMVQPGQYNSYDIFGNDHRQKNFNYQFGATKIYRDTTGHQDNGEYYEFSTFNVLGPTEIRINADDMVPVIYKYKNMEDDGLFSFTSNQLANGKISDAVNQMIADAIYSGKPNDIANAVVNKILANEEIQAAVQQLLYDMIHGKVDEIAQSPEEISQKIASLIIEKLKDVEWESFVYDKLVELLQELKVENPEEEAQQLAEQIANRIETSISQSDIYDAILPVLLQFENETLPDLVANISQTIYDIFAAVFSEENIYKKVYPIWTRFSEVSPVLVAHVADTLGTTLTNHFFDAEQLATSLEPFIATLRSTSTIKLPALAQDIIDQVLKPLIDQLNATFPAMEIDPDWDEIKKILTSALTLIKSSIDDQTDAEAAAALAERLIGIMDHTISNGVEAAILRLQDIPADQASQVIAAWVTNLVTVAEPEIVDYLVEKLNELTASFKAEEIAEELSAQIHAKILDIFSADNIYNLILPIMERLSEINIEAVAEKISGWLIDLVQDNISEEKVLATLTEIISQFVGNINPDEISQELVDRLLESDIVEKIDGDVLKKALEFKLYEFLIELGKELHAIEQVEIRLARKQL